MQLAEMEGKSTPRDWVEVYDRHNPYDWQLQMARYKVIPFGERRKDLREGWSRARQIESSASEQMSFDKVKAIAEQTANYVYVYFPEDELE